MERTEVLDMMSGLKLYGMRSAYDETLWIEGQVRRRQRGPITAQSVTRGPPCSPRH